MTAVAPVTDQATDLLQKLSLEPQTKPNSGSDVTKKSYGTTDGADRATAPAPHSDRSMTPLLQDFMDPSMCYLPNGYPSPTYYYGAFDGSVTDWDEYSRYVNSDEMQHAGVYGDIYHPGYGYAAYGAYAPGSPVPTMGHDGQLYGPQHYQYPGHYYPPATPTNSPFVPNNPPPSSQPEVSAPVSSNQPPATVDATKSNSNGAPNSNSNGNSWSVPLKTAPQNSSVSTNGSYAKGVTAGSVPASYPDSRYSYDGVRSPLPWVDCPTFPEGQQNRQPTTSSVSSPVFHAGNNPSNRNPNVGPYVQMMGLSPHRPNSGMVPGGPGIMNSLYPNARMFGQCGTAYRAGMGYMSNGFDARADGRGWVPVDSKFKPRGRGNGFLVYGDENMDGMGELNRGPRTGRVKVQKGPGPNVTIAVKGQALPVEGNKEVSTAVPNKDIYNQADFPEHYPDAKFFVIKSYSEDDVHKSIKYNVWASTASGNKKLDAAYHESKAKDGDCPVFLFFSVNTSGQFVGVAEMVGPVDFNKTVEYWQQDKWTGCFPLKWHIVKDVPNRVLKHITLENNENKPVTNSRDTQEVKLEPGLQILKLFKEHVSKTSILDDFQFYEARQKTMQERRVKQQQFQKQVWDGKVAGEANGIVAANGKVRIQKPSDLPALAELKPAEENGAGAAPASTMAALPNGVAAANVC
ncbi:YTH domain-containing protein ECT4-like [Wolffia australiana]